LAQKKTQLCSAEQKRELIDRSSTELTIGLQCKLLGLAKSTFYYEACRDDEFNLLAMKEIDRLYTAHPDYGKRRMSVMLRKIGIDVGVELARTLMKRMGLESIGPKPNLSKAHPSHKKYPYMLRGVEIVRPNQVWSTDITYVPMKCGFLYLTAVLDWYSRYILSWKLSNSLDGLFCREVVLEALERFGTPEWFNTDQGAQYTCYEFIKILEDAKIQISMDGKGRALDNVWIERFWRTIKYEEIYPREYADGWEAFQRLGIYFPYYNEERPHSALNYATPKEVYNGARKSDSDKKRENFCK
jgi:putative transposase